MNLRRLQSLGPDPVTSRPATAWRGVLAGLLGLACLLHPARGGSLRTDDPDPSAIAPVESSVIIRMDAARGDDVRWRGVVVDLIGMSVPDAETDWARTSEILERLEIDAAERIHAIDRTGSQWLHAARWRDAGGLESGLRGAAARPLGFGRFRFPEHRIDLAIAGDWVLLAPTGSPWLDDASERARIIGSNPRGGAPDGPGAIRIRMRHETPTGGMTRLRLTPLGPTEATIEIDGRYDASPLPTRIPGQVDARLIPSLRGRVAVAMLESGIGVLDPMLIRLAAEMPGLMPPPELRRSLAARRLVVLDGETVRVPRIGLIEVPAVCIAVPFRADAAPRLSQRPIDAMIHDWMLGSGRVLAMRSNRATDDAPTAPVEVRIARDEIRHVDLGDAFAESFGRHPASVAASLNWAIHRVEAPGSDAVTDPRTWLVVGSSPGIVRRVAGAIEGANFGMLEEGDLVCSQGVASPARLGLQVEDLAGLRAGASDAEAAPDAAILARLSSILGRFERVEWSTAVQSDDAVRASVRVTMAPEASEDRISDRPDGAGDGRRDP